MPKPTKGNRLGGSPSHQRIILANLVSQLFEHGKIRTTQSRARAAQPLAEKLITKAKRGDLHSHRLVAQTVRDKGVLKVLFTEIAPLMEGREGGYTRITKIGPRKGDNAPMVILELITDAPAKAEKPAQAEKSAKDEAPAKDEPRADEADRVEKVEETETEAAEADKADDADEEPKTEA